MQKTDMLGAYKPGRLPEIAKNVCWGQTVWQDWLIFVNISPNKRTEDAKASLKVYCNYEMGEIIGVSYI